VAHKASRQLAFRTERAAESVATLARLAPGLAGSLEEAARAIRAAGQEEWAGLEAELQRMARAQGAEELPALQLAPTDEWTERARGMVLRRTTRGPVEMSALLARLGREARARAEALLREHREAAQLLSVYMQYWTDGQRSLAEVADLAECEVGLRDMALMVQLAELMVEAGLLEIRN